MYSNVIRGHNKRFSVEPSGANDHCFKEDGEISEKNEQYQNVNITFIQHVVRTMLICGASRACGW